MKLINNITLNNVRKVFETSYFKISIILTLILALYGGYLSMGFNYLEGFISVLSGYNFFTIGVFIPFLIITICTYNYFDKNEYLISRLGSKKEYLKSLISTVFIVNLFVYIIVLIAIIISLNIFPKAGFGFIYNNALNCHNFVYLLFIIFRLFCLVQIVSIINVLLFKIIDEKIVIGANILLYGSFISLYYENVYAINNIFQIPLYIGQYLIIIKYKSFGLELICTMTYIICLILLGYLLFNIVKKRIGDIKV